MRQLAASTQVTPETEAEANQKAADRCAALEAGAARARCVGERQGGTSCATSGDGARSGDVAFQKWDGSAARVYRCGAGENGASSWLTAETYLTPGMAGANAAVRQQCEWQFGSRCVGERKENDGCYRNRTYAYQFTRVPGGTALYLQCYNAWAHTDVILGRWESVMDFPYRAVALPAPAADPPAAPEPGDAPPVAPPDASASAAQSPGGTESPAAAPAPAPPSGNASVASAAVAALAGMRATRSRAGLTLTLRAASPQVFTISAGAIACRIATGARTCTLRGAPVSRARKIKVVSEAAHVPFALPACTPKRVKGKRIAVCVVAARAT